MYKVQISANHLEPVWVTLSVFPNSADAFRDYNARKSQAFTSQPFRIIDGDGNVIS